MSNTSPTTCEPFCTEAAALYDFFYADRPWRQIAELYNRHLRLSHDRLYMREGTPEPGRLFEFGCGTGRMMQEMAKLGWEVVGCDPSKAMVEQAAAKGLKAIHSDPGEIWHPAIASDAITLPYTVLGYAALQWPNPPGEQLDPLLSLLRGLRGLLQPGGRLAFDFISTEAALHDLRPAVTDQGANWLRTSRRRYQEPILTVDLEWRTQHHHWRERHLIRTFRPGEITKALRETGFLHRYLGDLEQRGGGMPWHIFCSAEAV